MTKAATVLAVSICLLAPGALAGTFTESNPLYDLRVTYDFDGTQVRHQVELTNKLEIEVRVTSIESVLRCASGRTADATVIVPDGALLPGDSRRFRVEGDGCRPFTERDAATGRRAEVEDTIAAVDYSGRVAMAQHGTGSDGLVWDCGEERINVVAIKFPRGTGFRLVASNGRSMTSSEAFDPEAATAHLCTGPVEDPLSVTAGIRKLIGEVRTFCETAPRFCDKAYDVNNKRAATAVRG